MLLVTCFGHKPSLGFLCHNEIKLTDTSYRYILNNKFKIVNWNKVLIKITHKLKIRIYLQLRNR